MNFFLSPLEQFELSIFIPLYFFEIDLSLNTVSIYLFIVAILVFVFVFLCVSKVRIIPLKWQCLLELTYKFVLNLLNEQTKRNGLVYFPIFFSVFVFLLFSNLFGLLPFSFTVTAHIAVTFSLALSFNLAFMFQGLDINGLSFFKLFVPKGAPVFLLPLIIVIEVVSYLIRTLSLSVRLFANMMAGHTLLHILASFSVAFTKYKFPSVLVLLPLLMVFLVFFLELGIAFIQAYVFTILLCIYLNDSYHPDH